MPKTKTPKNLPKGKGGVLKKKVGPLPLPALLVLIALGIFILYKMRSRSSSATGIDSTATVTPAATLTPGQAAASGTPGGTFDPSILAGLLPNDYVTQTDLQSQLDSLGSNLASQIAGVTFQAPYDMPIGTGPSLQPEKPKNAPQRTGTTKPAANIVQKLANGTTITTTPTGRKIEQAPGKSPYVIAQGKGAPPPKKSVVKSTPTKKTRPGQVH